MATALRHAARRFGTRAAAEAEAEAIIERSPLHTSTRIVDSTTGRGRPHAQSEERCHLPLGSNPCPERGPLQHNRCLAS
uniref:Uncharacterized protein n=1 Tax=Triticum urartu TaxID=4572 RepID=A0A8R7Q8S7_TRIUA